MKKVLFTLLLAVLFVSCDDKLDKKKTDTGYVVKELNTKSPDSDQYVLIKTSKGDIKIKLYRETPLHRKNFINLVMNGYYNGQIFHRVVPGKLIQAGDYTSINDPDGKTLGENDVDYAVPAEIDATKRIHKRGALAAASSGGHFYIVTNKKVKAHEVDDAEKEYTKKLVNIKLQELMKPHTKELNRLRKQGESNNRKKDEYDKRVNELYKEAKKLTKDFHYTTTQRNTYLGSGGLPGNDANYTVFGEVVEGMDVVDAISWVSIYKDGIYKERPLDKVYIKEIKILNGRR